MLNVSEAVKQKYLSDDYRGTFQFTIGSDSYDSTNIKSGSVEIIESLYSSESLDFSAVEKGSLKFTLGNIDQTISDLLNKQLVLNQIVQYTESGVQQTETVPLGVYTITESKRSGEYFMDVTAYDNLLLFDKGVTSWWNNLTFPVTIRELLVSLCTYCGATYSFPASFTNSTFEIAKNASFENVKGKDVLGWIQQVCACFIKADRNGQIVIVNLPSGTWSTATPAVTYDVYNIISNLEISDYETDPITGVVSRATQDDIGVHVGDTSNAYIIENNPLLYDLTQEQSVTPLTNILNKISNIIVKPVSGVVKGLCYIECGDLIKIQSFKGAIAIAPVTYRRLHSNGLMRDEIKIKGTEKQEVIRPLDSSIRALNQKTHVLVSDVEQLRSEIEQITTGEHRKQYFLSTSNTRVEDEYNYPSENLFPSENTYPRITWGGDWQYEVPSILPDLVFGHYMWTRDEVRWSDGTIEYTDPVLDGDEMQIIATTRDWKSSFNQLSDEIVSKVSYTEYDANNEVIYDSFSTITQKADSIELKVDTTAENIDPNHIISTINASQEGIKISGDLISLIGDVYFYSNNEDDTTQPAIRIYRGVLSTLNDIGSVGIRIYSSSMNFYSWQEPGIKIGSIAVGDAGAGYTKSLLFYVQEDNRIALNHEKTVSGALTQYQIASYEGATRNISIGTTDSANKTNNIDIYGTLVAVNSTTTNINSTNISLTGSTFIDLTSDSKRIRLDSNGLIIANDTSRSNYVQLHNNYFRANVNTLNSSSNGRIEILSNGRLEFTSTGQTFYPYYASGDTYDTGTGSFQVGIVSNSSKSIYLMVHVPYNMAKVTPTVTSVNGRMKTYKGDVNSSTSNIEWTTGRTVNAVKLTDNFTLRITITQTSAYTNVTNNTPLTLYGRVQLTFS